MTRFVYLEVLALSVKKPIQPSITTLSPLPKTLLGRSHASTGLFGAPATVYTKLKDAEVHLISQPASKTILRLVANADVGSSNLQPPTAGLMIELFESVPDLPRLWRSVDMDGEAKSRRWRGMVSVANWGQERIE